MERFDHYMRDETSKAHITKIQKAQAKLANDKLRMKSKMKKLQEEMDTVTKKKLQEAKSVANFMHVKQKDQND